MSKRILIANRGEIAARIARAINELGYISIGLYTDNEPEAYHLQFCNEWLHLSGKSSAETYLNVDKIVDICKKYKIDAVHPGYGFLSENTHFCAALEKVGVTFIGPNAEAIRVMGDKAISKTLAKKVGVPTVPGSLDSVDTLEEAIKISDQIEYPVLLKAVAGGGGRGMRICHSKEDVEKNYDAVKREAKSAFGYEGLLVEKFIVNPRAD
jgi:acetyl-CoA carboxylase biotin carboxylase subunit